MIINCSKHGRTQRDTKKLAVHLYKAENDFVILAEVGNTAASDLTGTLRDREFMRDGAVPAAAAFIHFPLSPATDRTPAEITQAAHMVRLEFDPAGVRPYAILIHGKERAGGAAGRVHGHLVLGNFDSAGRAIKDGFSKLRTERVSREIEHSWRDGSPGSTGEPCGLGRHHRSVLRALRKSNPAVAQWLANNHGEDPDQPKSAISSAGRHRAKRLDFNLPAARVAIQKMWAEKLKIGQFKAALSDAGFEIAAGTKAGVWVLRDIKSGLVLGAIDRLLKLKRQTVRNMMMETTDERKHETRAGPRAAHGRKLFDQNKGIAASLDQLQPLLALIEEKGEEPEGDPIAQILDLLTTLVTTQQRQDQHQQVLSRKLDFIIARLNAAGQFSGSTE